MSRVKARDTKPELAVRRAVWAGDLRYRLHDRRLPGTPDLVFSKRRIALFVHGCFWHQHPGCPAARMPKSRLDFWESKLEGNVARDARKQAELESLGWKVMVIWECQTRDQAILTRLVECIRRTVGS